jgi:membrane dipeptidase
MSNPDAAPLILDAHLDLSMNAMEWNRDLRRPVHEIRETERGLSDKPDRCNGTVSFPAMRAGSVGICVATQIARYVRPGNELPGWHSPEQAWAQSQGQLAWYRAMEEQGELRRITDRAGLEAQVALWSQAPATGVGASGAHDRGTRGGAGDDRPPIGYVLSLEGADSILSMRHLERAWEYGLRAIGPAHYGPGVYANGTDSTDGLPETGRELLREMDGLGMILDVTHLNDRCFREALDIFHGPVWASHNNCRALVDHNRQFSDQMISELIERGAVIGVALDAWMMVPGWVRGTSTPRGAGVTLELLADNVDHICRLAGDCVHVGIGSDLDGGFGTEQCPKDLDTIADLQKIPGILRQRGYSGEDISLIMSGNFLRFLTDALPKDLR